MIHSIFQSIHLLGAYIKQTLSTHMSINALLFSMWFIRILCWFPMIRPVLVTSNASSIFDWPVQFKYLWLIYVFCLGSCHNMQFICSINPLHFSSSKFVNYSCFSLNCHAIWWKKNQHSNHFDSWTIFS